MVLMAGCYTDVVTTGRVDDIKDKCVQVKPLDAQNPSMGKVLRDILVKELIRKDVSICDADNANVIITGSAFMTDRSVSSQNFLGSSARENQAIESVSLVARDKEGNVLLSASYDNVKRYTASKLAKQLGSALADKLK